MLPIGVGYPRPISLSVLPDKLILHRLHSSIVFKARLRSDACTKSRAGMTLEPIASDQIVTIVGSARRWFVEFGGRVVES